MTATRGGSTSAGSERSADCHGYIGFIVSKEGDPVKIKMLKCSECELPAVEIALGRGGRCILHGGGS